MPAPSFIHSIQPQQRTRDSGFVDSRTRHAWASKPAKSGRTNDAGQRWWGRSHQLTLNGLSARISGDPPQKTRILCTWTWILYQVTTYEWKIELLSSCWANLEIWAFFETKTCLSCWVIRWFVWVLISSSGESCFLWRHVWEELARIRAESCQIGWKSVWRQVFIVTWMLKPRNHGWYYWAAGNHTWFTHILHANNLSQIFDKIVMHS